MEKNTNVWNRLKDELKSAIEMSNDYLDNKAINELKTKKCYTSVSYGTFNTLKGFYVQLGNSHEDSMFFTDYLKTE